MSGYSHLPGQLGKILNLANGGFTGLSGYSHMLEHKLLLQIPNQVQYFTPRTVILPLHIIVGISTNLRVAQADSGSACATRRNNNSYEVSTGVK